MNSVAGDEADTVDAGNPGFGPEPFSIWGDIRFANDAFLQAKVQ